MRIAKSEYTIEELVLCLSFVLFFLTMAIGGANFDPPAYYFPLFLSIPGLVLIILYVVRGWLPPTIGKVMTGSSGFLEQSEKLVNSSDDEDVMAEVGPSLSRSYRLFGFTFAFIFVSYLTGFYLSVLLFLALHLYVSRTFKARTLKGNLVLITILLATVYVFDTAFGYHFNQGVLVSFPW